jgi:hypothetical protein
MPTLHGTLLKAAGLLLALTTAVAAQDYPNKPVRLIIPFPARRQQRRGRAADRHPLERAARQAGRGGQPRRGAGGVVGTEVAANAPHDGYTLLIISLAHAVNPWLYKLPYDPIKSFTPDRHSCAPAERAGGQPDLPVHSVQDCSPSPSRSRPAAIRLGRHRQLPASRRRTVQAHRRRQSCCTCRSRAADPP